MKNYFKFMIVVASMTFAIFGSTNKAFALKKPGEGTCTASDNTCGYTTLGNVICGDYHRNAVE